MQKILWKTLISLFSLKDLFFLIEVWFFLPLGRSKHAESIMISWNILWHVFYHIFIDIACILIASNITHTLFALLAGVTHTYRMSIPKWLSVTSVVPYRYVPTIYFLSLNYFTIFFSSYSPPNTERELKQSPYLVHGFKRLPSTTAP